MAICVRKFRNDTAELFLRKLNITVCITIVGLIECVIWFNDDCFKFSIPIMI